MQLLKTLPVLFTLTISLPAQTSWRQIEHPAGYNQYLGSMGGDIYSYDRTNLFSLNNSKFWNLANTRELFSISVPSDEIALMDKGGYLSEPGPHSSTYSLFQSQPLGPTIDWIEITFRTPKGTFLQSQQYHWKRRNIPLQPHQSLMIDSSRSTETLVIDKVRYIAFEQSPQIYFSHIWQGAFFTRPTRGDYTIFRQVGNGPSTAVHELSQNNDYYESLQTFVEAGSNLIGIVHRRNRFTWEASRRIIVTSDGINWHDTGATLPHFTLRHTHFHNGRLTLLTEHNGKSLILSSTDLADWSTTYFEEDTNLTSLTHHETQWAAITEDHRVFNSHDAVTWSETDPLKFDGTINHLVSINNYWVAATDDGIWTSKDSLSWKQQASGSHSRIDVASTFIASQDTTNTNLIWTSPLVGPSGLDIITQPQSIDVDFRDTTTLSVTTTIDDEAGYQWYYKDFETGHLVPIDNAIDSTLLVSPGQRPTTYFVEVSHKNDFELSEGAIVTGGFRPEYLGETSLSIYRDQFDFDLNQFFEGDNLTFQWFQGKSEDQSRPLPEQHLTLASINTRHQTFACWAIVTNAIGQITTPTIIITPRHRTYQNWLLDHNLDPTSPSNAPHASILGDGHPNSLRFSLGLSPSQKVPPFQIHNPGLPMIQLNTPVLPEDFIIEMEFSTDLKTWSTEPLAAGFFQKGEDYYDSFDGLVPEFSNTKENYRYRWVLKPPHTQHRAYFLRLHTKLSP